MMASLTYTLDSGFAVRPVGHPCASWTQSCVAWLRDQGILSRDPPRR